MLAVVLEAIFQVTLQLLLEFALYWLGKLIVTALTLGRLPCDFYDRDSTWSNKWLIFGRDEDGTYLTAEATTIVGLVAAIVMVGFYLVW